MLSFLDYMISNNTDNGLKLVLYIWLKRVALIPINTWARNNASPVLRRDATVVTKRTKVWACSLLKVSDNHYVTTQNSIMMMKMFFDNIPISLEEAAKMDGVSRTGILFRIVMPLSKPGIFAVGIYSFIMSWDDLLYSLTLITKDTLRTLNPGISGRSRLRLGKHYDGLRRFHYSYYAAIFIFPKIYGLWHDCRCG